MSPPSEAPDSPEQGNTEQPSSQRTAGVVGEDLSTSAGPRVILWLRFGATVVLFVSILGVAAHAVNSEQERLAVAGVEAGALTWLYGLSLLFLAVVFLPGIVADTGRVTRVLTRLRRRRIAVASAVSLLVLVAAGAWMVLSMDGSEQGYRKPANFYDTETGKLFHASVDKFPPIESPAGNPAVRVYFFSCGECNEEERFIGYYHKLSASLKQRAENGKPPGPGDSDEILRSVDGETWLPSNSDDFKEAREEKWTCENGERATPCY